MALSLTAHAIMDLDSALADKPAEGATATDILRADHDEVDRLFADYARADGEVHARRLALKTLCMQLELHDRLEQSVVYPALREIVPDLADAAIREHAEIRNLIAELRERDDCDADCAATMSRLQTVVERHVREEEDTLFPRIERESDTWLRELGVAIVKCKEALTRSTEEFEGPAT